MKIDLLKAYGVDINRNATLLRIKERCKSLHALLEVASALELTGEFVYWHYHVDDFKKRLINELIAQRINK